jgi:molybdopterin-synthase adenylyltransferase
MIKLIIQELYAEQVLGLLDNPVESCVVLLTRSAASSGGGEERLLAWSIDHPPAEAYRRRSVVAAELSPDYVARISRVARDADCGIVFCHTHPGIGRPEFSSTDDRGEEVLAAFLERRLPSSRHVSLVLSRGGFAARELGRMDSVGVSSVGRRLRTLTAGRPAPLKPEYDRQIRAFGKDGQDVVARLRVGIVGLGGTGSVVAEQLSHLGVSDFVLIDPDVVEPTNLNRLVGSSPEDIGRAKIDLASALIRRINPSAAVNGLAGDVTRSSVAKRLLDCDFLFGCTDSHGSRAVIQQIAYQYLIPSIDMGSVIAAKDGQVTHVNGRVQLLAPGLPCLICSGLLDSSQVRRDMMTPLERANDPYILGGAEPAPAVISLNSTVSSLAVTMFLNVVTEIPGTARHLLYDAVEGVLRRVAPLQNSNCPICSFRGALARGDSTRILARMD